MDLSEDWMGWREAVAALLVGWGSGEEHQEVVGLVRAVSTLLGRGSGRAELAWCGRGLGEGEAAVGVCSEKRKINRQSPPW